MRSELIHKPLGERARFLRFLLTGGVAAGVNVGSGIVFNLLLPYEFAIMFAYLAGMTTAFVLARLFVFERAGSTVQSQYLRFAIVNVVAFAQVWLVSVGFARFFFPWLGWTWHTETLAHMIGVASPVVTSYFGHKLFSFR